MKATVWLMGAVVLVGVAVLALWTDRQDDATTVGVSSPASVGEGDNETQASDPLARPTKNAESIAASPGGPVAIAPEIVMSNEKGSVPSGRESLPAHEDALPSEAKLQVGDALDVQCAMQVMADDRFADAIRALSEDAASVPAALEMRAAIAAAYREAFALAGGGAELASLACGRRVCLVEAHLPADTAEDEVRTAVLGRLLGNLGSPAVAIELPTVDSGPRIARRVFSVSPALTRTDRRATSCLPSQ